MKANGPNDPAPAVPPAEGAPREERRFARRIDCTPCERAARPAAPNHAGAPTQPRDVPHP